MVHPDVPTVQVDSMPAGAALVDVREDDEWHAGHVEGALHVPLGELTARHGELPADQPVVVVCRSGNRSSRATAWLVANGHDAANLAGGMQAWSRSGQPMVSESGRPPQVI